MLIGFTAMFLRADDKIVKTRKRKNIVRKFFPSGIRRDTDWSCGQIRDGNTGPTIITATLQYIIINSLCLSKVQPVDNFLRLRKSFWGGFSRLRMSTGGLCHAVATLYRDEGGEYRIWTCEGVSPQQPFQGCAINRSANSPLFFVFSFSC